MGKFKSGHNRTNVARSNNTLDHDVPAVAELGCTDRKQFKYIEGTEVQPYNTEESALEESEASTATPNAAKEEQPEENLQEPPSTII